ncbi:hypothetical protein [Burkholderia sp. Ac-20365]|jgi:hypothetical protein|uniref:hypothetical protein n=1 Tax=Burkholderia sp. Ac-20365 TaxID=2703897 RepID=UPI00197BF764|nr:hypothetical protein [Burkholderia sp. Ac-20365]MBN3764916.1 hypothetical protein [Burkholderia sp. Ac-20365]
MKVFLLSDLVVHELVSMQLEGQWLTAEQFSESATLWASRHGYKDKLSRPFLAVLRREAVQIAQGLTGDVESGGGQGSPLKRLLLDIPAVNYADPVSARALAASLEVCRAKLCDRCSRCADGCGAAGSHETGWRCHPVLRTLLCGEAAASRGMCDDGHHAAIACARDE